MLFGPAYKGIPLAAVTAMTLHKDYGIERNYTYNRKEAKDVCHPEGASERGKADILLQHGEGGTLVGAPLKGRIVIIDDVLTRGTAIREAISIIRASPEAELVGVVQLVDRQERGTGTKSTVQEVEEEFGVPIEAILRLEDLVTYMETKGGMDKELAAVRKYRQEYGIQA